MYKDSIKVKQLDGGTKNSFEFGVWSVCCKSVTFTVIGLYRPPYSNQNKYTINDFIDELLKFMEFSFPKYKNILLMGDFNIQLDNSEDPDVEMFSDTMTTIGYQQHVNFYTHNKSHILDHVYSETEGEIQVLSCKMGQFISDHCSVKVKISVPKENMLRVTSTGRNIKEIETHIFKEALHGIKLNEDTNVDDMVKHFEDSLIRVLDELAPCKTTTRTIRHPKPWFNEEILAQKRIVRRRERIWHKYHEDHQWQALCVSRNKYNWMIRESKKEVISSSILGCKGNTKELYKIFNQIAGVKEENPMPSGFSNEDLANTFADYFMDKILDIRQSLCHKPKYEPKGVEATTFCEFRELSPAEIRSIIKSMPTKSCELDVLPAKLIKQYLDDLLPLITTIINTSLYHGVFVSQWKVAVIRPLLKFFLKDFGEGCLSPI